MEAALVVILTLTCLTLAFLYRSNWNSPGTTATGFSVTEIHIYPVKSCKGIPLQESRVGPYGLINDRKWMVIHEGNFITLRQKPIMALIQPTITEEYLLLEAPGREILKVALAPGRRAEGPLINVTIWGGEHIAVDEGDIAGLWLSELLGCSVRLVRQTDNHNRKTPSHHIEGHPNTVSFADGFPVLLTSEGSLKELNSRMKEALPMSRFRSNIVVHGPGPGFTEDQWSRIRIGDVCFSIVKPCARCKATTVDGLTGSYHGSEPLETLRKFRKRLDMQGVFFGQNLTQENEGVIRVGDLVQHKT